MKLENTDNASFIDPHSKLTTNVEKLYFQRHLVSLTDEMMEKACTYIDFVTKCEYKVLQYYHNLVLSITV